MYLHLFHGREDPEKQMDNWGENGPVFRIDGLHVTYGHTIHVRPALHAEWEDFILQDSMILYNGMWYGDWSVFTGEIDPRAAAHSEEIDVAKMNSKVKL